MDLVSVASEQEEKEVVSKLMHTIATLMSRCMCPQVAHVKTDVVGPIGIAEMQTHSLTLAQAS